MALDFAATMGRLNEKLLDTFTDELTYDGKVYECIAPPIERLNAMALGPYDPKSEASFQMRLSDFTASGMKLQDSFTHQIGDFDPLTFSVYAYRADNNDSLVNLRCHLKT